MKNLKSSKLIKKLYLAAQGNGTNSQIAEQILINLNNLEIMTSEKLANDTFTTQSTISKFVKSIGYDSYLSFRKSLISYKENTYKSEKYTYNLKEDILLFTNSLEEYDFSNIISGIQNSPKIIIIATGGACRVSNEFYISLQRAGYNIKMGRDFSSKYAFSMKSDENSFIITISNSRKTPETTIPEKVSISNGSKVFNINGIKVKPSANSISFSHLSQKESMNHIEFNLFLSIFFSWILSKI